MLAENNGFYVKFLVLLYFEKDSDIIIIIVCARVSSRSIEYYNIIKSIYSCAIAYANSPIQYVPIRTCYRDNASISIIFWRHRFYNPTQTKIMATHTFQFIAT